MTEMICKDCDQVVLFVTPPSEEEQNDGDLMCEICGAAITLGGVLQNERAVRRSAAA